MRSQRAGDPVGRVALPAARARVGQARRAAAALRPRPRGARDPRARPRRARRLGLGRRLVLVERERVAGLTRPRWAPRLPACSVRRFYH